MSRYGDFLKSTKNTLARRVNDFCSNPDCDAVTSGPHSDPAKVILSGEAAHIYSAKSNGPRPNPDYSEEQFSSIENGIWLCRNCHAVVDADDSHYTPQQLQDWKIKAEALANQQQIKPKKREQSNSKLVNVHQKWVHETTNDKDYVPRQAALDSLNSWSKNENVKVITVTGIGGQGKTSLVGHWLQNDEALTARAFKGLFYWSFYSEQDISIFFKELIQFCYTRFDLHKHQGKFDDQLEALRNILSEFCLCVVLDGLEVIQHELSKRTKGQFVDSDLRNFLTDICLSPNKSLAILTSRFDIVDLRQFSKQVRSLPLGNLTDAEASHLLQRLYVGGTSRDHHSINQSLEGHPLALRVFAAGLPREKQGNPISHLNSLLVFGEKEEHTLSEKINRLLLNYEKSLSDIQISLLCGVSLLHKPMDEESLIVLCAKQQSIEAEHEKLKIEPELASLVISGLVLKEIVSNKILYSCHPIIRDFFRTKITQDTDQARLVGGFLAGRPGELEVDDTETLEWVVSSIEVLTECGSWLDANYLYSEKLKNGLLMQKLARPEYGWRCAIALSNVSAANVYRYDVFYDLRAPQENTKAFYLSSAGQFSLMMGDLENAKLYYKKALESLSKSSSVINKAVYFDYLAEVSIQSGDLYESHNSLGQAINFAAKRPADTAVTNQLNMSRGRLHLLRSELLKSKTRFKTVFDSFNWNQKKGTDLKSESAYGLAELEMLNLNYEDALNFINIGDEFAELHNRQDLLMQGHFIKGKVFYETQNYSLAAEELIRAEKIARRSKMEFWVVKVTILQALLMSNTNQGQKALISVEDCIEVASSRKFGILYVDALIAKAAVLLNSGLGSLEDIQSTLSDSEIEVDRLGYKLAVENINLIKRISQF